MTDAPRLGLLRRALTGLSPALLCAVALLQIVVTSQTALSPWKLGGFGMYASVDSVRSRWVRVRVATPGGELPVVFDRLVEDRPALRHAARNVQSFPTPARLGALGQGLLAAGVWADCTPAPLAGSEGRVAGPHVRILSAAQVRAQGCRSIPVQGLTLELWRYRYDSAERKLRGEKLVAARVARGRP